MAKMPVDDPPPSPAPVASQPVDDLTLGAMIALCVSHWVTWLAVFLMVVNSLFVWHLMAPIRYEAEMVLQFPKLPMKQEGADDKNLAAKSEQERFERPDAIGGRLKEHYKAGCEEGKSLSRAFVHRGVVLSTHPDQLVVTARGENSAQTSLFLESVYKRIARDYELRKEELEKPLLAEVSEVERLLEERKNLSEEVSKLAKPSDSGWLPLLRLLSQRNEQLLLKRRGELELRLAELDKQTLQLRTPPNETGVVGGRSLTSVGGIAILLGSLLATLAALLKERLSVKTAVAVPIETAKPGGRQSVSSK